MYHRHFKRAIDVAAALLASIVLSPVALAIVIAMMISDPGPVIFRQRRIGRNAKVFTFYKFRSMPVNTGDIPSDKVGDLALTWIGRVLRRTNLDELPQLFNIARGDMSLVGPRPPIPAQAELIELRRVSGALACRPGLTGWAQVNSFDGMSVASKAALDADYARNVTLAMDMRIVFSTFAYLLKPPPKY